MYVLRALYVEEKILGEESTDKKMWIGILTLVGVFMEVVVMFYGKPLLFKFKKSWLLAAALLSITLRVGAYCIIPENDRRWIWFVLFTEAFIRGIGNGAIQIEQLIKQQRLQDLNCRPPRKAYLLQFTTDLVAS